MGFLQGVRDMLSGKKRQETMVMYFSNLHGNTIMYPNQNDQQFVNWYDNNDLVFSIIDFAAGKAASLPYKHYIMKDGEKVEVENSEVIKRLNNPNPLWNKQDLLHTFFAYSMVCGQSYMHSPRIESGNNKGKINELWVLPAHLTKIVSDGWRNPIKGYMIECNGYTENFPPEDVMRITRPNLGFNDDSGLLGMSPLKPGTKVVHKSDKNTDARTALYDNGAPMGVLSPKAFGRDADGKSLPMNSTQEDKAMKNFKNKHGGSDKFGAPWMVPFPADWQAIGFDYNALGLGEDRLESLRSICRLFHIPSVLFGDSDMAKYKNMMEAKKAGWTDCIIPMVKSFEDAFAVWCMGGDGYEGWIEADYSDVDELKKDMQTLVKTYFVPGMPVDFAYEKVGVPEHKKYEGMIFGNMSTMIREDELMNPADDDNNMPSDDETEKYFKSLNTHE